MYAESVVCDFKVRPPPTESQVTVRARTPAEEAEISTMVRRQFSTIFLCPPQAKHFEVWSGVAVDSALEIMLSESEIINFR